SGLVLLQASLIASAGSWVCIRRDWLFSPLI
ncbi:unnamed protein product, partial [Allacma fusca]